MVKWLPNAMGIDPSDAACDSFYTKMKELGLVLLSHGGEEKAVEAEEDQRLGNPLLLRRALDHGVRTIVAHCASLGENEDLDDPGRRRVHNFHLFLRLVEDRRYEGLVFGDISAMTQFNRIGQPLSTVIEREELHGRLVNGSDYPLPAINLLIRTKPLVRAGYLNAEEASFAAGDLRLQPAAVRLRPQALSDSCPARGGGSRRASSSRTPHSAFERPGPIVFNGLSCAVTV